MSIGDALKDMPEEYREYKESREPESPEITLESLKDAPCRKSGVFDLGIKGYSVTMEFDIGRTVIEPLEDESEQPEADKAIIDGKPRSICIGEEWHFVVLVGRKYVGRDGLPGIMYREAVDNATAQPEYEPDSDYADGYQGYSRGVADSLGCPDCDSHTEPRSMPDGIEQWCPMCNVRVGDEALILDVIFDALNEGYRVRATLKHRISLPGGGPSSDLVTGRIRRDGDGSFLIEDTRIELSNVESVYKIDERGQRI